MSAFSEASLPEEEIELFFAASSCVSSAAAASSAKQPVDPAVALIRRRNVDVALESFRKASTNVGTSPTTIKEAREQLLSALSDLGVLEQALAVFAERMESLKAEREPKPPSFRDKRCYQQQLMQEIVRGLFVGSYHPANDAALLKTHKVTHLLCCVNVTPKLSKQSADDFKFLVLPAEDNDGYDISQFFAKAFAFIDEALSQGGGILVYCGAGISRSVTVVAAYLIQKMKVSAFSAVDMIQKKRAVARPNNGFMKQLQQVAEQQGL